MHLSRRTSFVITFMSFMTRLRFSSGPNFMELLRTQICLVWQLFFWYKKDDQPNLNLLHLTGIQLLFAYPENHVEIRLVIPFLSRTKIRAKQICLLSSSMKLGPVWFRLGLLTIKMFRNCIAELTHIDHALCTRQAFLLQHNFSRTWIQSSL